LILGSDNKSYVKLPVSAGICFEPLVAYSCLSNFHSPQGGNAMKMLVTASLIFGLGLVSAWSGAAAGGDDPKDKVQTVGKGGLKIGAKITDNDKKFDFTIDLGGKEFQLPMQAKPYSVKLEANKRYTITLDTDDDDLDPFLVVQDAGGKTVAFDDD